MGQLNRIVMYNAMPSDPGLPITKEMIIEGKIPRPDGSFIPPATPIQI